MRKYIIPTLLLSCLIISCKNQRDECVENLINESGYDYESACEACDEEAESSGVRYEK